jgi:glycine/D-amino acid oxidase-like deaminating enzyme
MASLPDRCHVAIVGGGVTGLSCACRLAELGHDVVVVDRAFGDGATCRSGGIIVGDTVIGPAPGFADCHLELRAWIEEHDVECSLQWTGCAELDRVDDTVDGTQSPTGCGASWRDGRAVRVTRMVDGGTLDPASLLSGLAHTAHRSGAQLVDAAEAFRFTLDGGHIIIETSAGTLRCDGLVAATDASAIPGDGADPWPERSITVVLETSAIDGEVTDAIGWHGRWPFYTNDFPLLWGRLMPSGGLMAGRELVPLTTDADSLRRDIDDAGRRLTARIRGLHPALASIGIRRVWAGPIARDARGIPAIVRHPSLPNTWLAGGYGGHGIAQAFRVGRRVADQVG